MKNKVLVVGLGQCGNKIADIFGRNGYASIGINTAEEDMKSLANIKKIAIGNHGGSGKDRNLAIEQLKGEFSTIFETIKEHSSNKDFIIVCSSLGGGTGSGTIVATSSNVANFLKKKVIVAGVLPLEDEGINLKSNAIQAISELDKVKNSINVLLEKNGDHDKINNKIFKKIDSVFNIKGKAITSFDRMDLINSFRNGYLEIVTGYNDTPEFDSELFELKTAKSINLVTSTRKKLKGDSFLSAYKALNRNFFEYKTSEKDNYFAIFSQLNAPIDYIHNTKNEIETLYKEVTSTEEEVIDFGTSLNLNDSINVSKHTKNNVETEEMEFNFNF